MSAEHGGEKPQGNTEAPAKDATMQEGEHDPGAGKPSMTGMLGMHIDEPEGDAASGSPGADIDRNLLEEK